MAKKNICNEEEYIVDEISLNEEQLNKLSENMLALDKGEHVHIQINKNQELIIHKI